MVAPKELVSKLREFGLNSYESKLWTALLSRGVSTAGELSDISNVPRSRAYDVLESLEKKGFIITKLGKPIKYLAVPPVEVIERVKKRVEEEATRRSKILDGLNESPVLGELNLLHKNGIEKVDPTERSGSFRGRDKVYDHLSTMIKNAEKKITLMTTDTGFVRKVARFKNDLEKAVKRGVKVRIASQFGDSTKKFMKDLQGIECKHTDKTNRFCSIDGSQLMMMLMDDKNVHESFDSAVWISTPYFVQHFDDLFEKDWKDMKKL
ncbi:MAG TPA: helix-turn-helix domain-containing protein [Candidatus Nanoarchaeia archaeon]|nr:helix-turn-helix domain-containing protein [Candidatus Nanoarchaeia archaeon]